MVDLVSLVCPACGSSFHIQEGQKSCFCSYCGTQILVDDGSKTYTYVHKTVDEARIREADLTELLELKRMEAEEKKRQDKKKTAKTLALIGAIILGVGALLANIKFESLGPGIFGIFCVCLIGPGILFTALGLYCSASFGKEQNQSRKMRIRK